MKLRHKKQKRLGSVIKPYILISIATKNLLDKKLRTMLTMMGIVIGVGAVVFLISLALGYTELLINRYLVQNQLIQLMLAHQMPILFC